MLTGSIVIDIVIIGSAALSHYLSSTRTPKDFDFIAKYDDAIEYIKSNGEIKMIMPSNGGKSVIAKNRNQIFEAEIAWEGSVTEELYNYVINDQKSIRYSGRIFNFIIPSLDVLYTLKMSHRYRKNSPHFLKTMNDIIEMRLVGASIPDDLKEWFKKRELETYSYKHPNLMQDKKGFFSADDVKYVYDHDSIHEAVAIYDRPAYTMYAKDGNEVFSDKNKFFSLPEEYRIAGVYEEACVLAIERSLVPFPDKKTPFDAFSYALEKVCTSITSGWFREYAWENYHEVISFYHTQDCYYAKFVKAVEQNQVQMFA